MPTQRFLYNINTRFILVAALSGVLATGVVAQGRDNSSSDRNGSSDATITHKIDTTDGRGNRRASSSSKADQGALVTADKTDQSGANASYRQNSPPTRKGSSSEDISATSNGYQGYRNDRGKQTDRTTVENRKPEIPSSTTDNNRYNSDRRNNGSGIDDNQSVDTRNRGDRGGMYDKPAIDKHKPELPSSHSNTWQNNTDRKANTPGIESKRSNDNSDQVYRSKPSIDSRKPQSPSSRTDSWQSYGDRRGSSPSVTHKVIVDNRNRDYRDKVPAYSQDRDRNNDRSRNQKPPIFREGRYSYSSRPDYRPSLFGYWAFNDDPGFCRSVYFYYGYFPYMDTVRVHVGPYAEVGYYGVPVRVSDDDYYLASRAHSGLDYTLSDIRNSWIDGRADLIENHVQDDQSIAVLLDGKYDYSIEAKDYIQMTTDAIDATKTISFTWETVRKRTDGDYTAFGKHTYKNSEGDTKIVYVSYTLSRATSTYYIAEVGSSDQPLY